MTFPNAAVFAGKFAEEARDRLKVLTAALLRLEEVPGNRDAAADVLRQAHNIKGSARMLGFLDISDVVHAIEELVVGSTRDGSAMVPPAFDALFAAVDVLGARVEQLAGGVTDPADVTAVCQQLTRLAHPDGQPSLAAPGNSAGTPRGRTREYSLQASVTRCECRSRDSTASRTWPRSWSSRACRRRSGIWSCAA